ncbi:hypothetical protein [Streptomyces sp. NPDC048637]|uniref:hypothetical protein n=1 Tax=Streptomyces sp. NPDC048637 TaxID=3155636 RepID=UPI00342A601E
MSSELSSISRQPSTSGSSAADNTRPAVPTGLAFAICLVAANLRTGLSGVGTLLPAIEHGSGLTSSWGGLLSTLPLLTLAATPPLAARTSLSRLAWQVSIFRDLHSLGLHTAVAWPPSILIRRCTTSTTAGWMPFFYRLIALAASSLLPLLTRGRHDQRWTAAGTSVVVAGGFAALMSAPRCPFWRAPCSVWAVASASSSR